MYLGEASAGEKRRSQADAATSAPRIQRRSSSRSSSAAAADGADGGGGGGEGAGRGNDDVVPSSVQSSVGAAVALPRRRSTNAQTSNNNYTNTNIKKESSAHSHGADSVEETPPSQLEPLSEEMKAELASPSRMKRSAEAAEEIEADRKAVESGAF